MKSWLELPKSVHDTMTLMGDFGPTSVAKNKEVKGVIHDINGGWKMYLTAHELRCMADDLHLAAAWLDERADAEPEAKKS